MTTTIATEKLRISFANMSLLKSTKERVEDFLKPLYWIEGQEPEDWRDFDGDIKINPLQNRGGNCAEIEVSAEWAKWMIEFISSKRWSEKISSLDLHEGGDKNILEKFVSYYEREWQKKWYAII